VAAGLSLGDLQRLMAEKEAQVAKMHARRDELAEELAALDAELAGAGGGKKRGRKPGRPKGKRGPGRPKGSKNKAKATGKRGPGRPKGSKNKPKTKKAAGKRGPKGGPKGASPLHDMIRTALKSSSEPVKLADLAEKVKAAGYQSKSDNFAVILGLRLSEMKDVKRVDRGVYTMK
jgi:hypothetical protein